MTSTQKKMGRPVTGAGVPVQVRLPGLDLRALDQWIADQPDPKPKRPEGIRALIRVGLMRSRSDSAISLDGKKL
jgi:hypothetical protein